MFIQYQTFDYHYASKLNPRLYDIIDYEVDPDTSVLAVDGNYDNGAPRSAVNLHTRKIEDLDKLLLWIENLIPQCARNFVKQDYLDNLSRVRKTGGNGGLRSNSFKIDSCWGILFNKGNSLIKHNHFPYSISFVYCVNSPKGSSPLIIEGENINLVPGRIIFFLSHYYHWVPLNKCDGRCSIVGNILYTP